MPNIMHQYFPSRRSIRCLSGFRLFLMAVGITVSGGKKWLIYAIKRWPMSSHQKMKTKTLMKNYARLATPKRDISSRINRSFTNRRFAIIIHISRWRHLNSTGHY